MSEPLTRSIIEQRHLIARYVTGKLSEDEASAFEDFCVAHPDIAEQVETEQQLAAGIALLARNSPGEFAAVRPRRRASVTWAIAASLLLALGILFVTRNFETALAEPVLLATVSTLPETGDVSVFRLAMTRGSASPTVSAAPGQRVRIDVAASFNPQARYTVELYDVGQPQPLSKLSDLSPSSTSNLQFALAAGALPAGDYLLRIQEAGSESPDLNIDFRID